MEEQKEQLLNLIDSLEPENIELALEISKGLGLIDWVKLEIKSLLTYLNSFWWLLESEEESYVYVSQIDDSNAFRCPDYPTTGVHTVRRTLQGRIAKSASILRKFI